MICFNCGGDAGNDDRCPVCGANMRVYREILYASVAAYNEGLERAKVRDLSGALESLHKSLRFDKYNTSARNLLGLVYYEMGQTAFALREWVVSKNFQPKNNPVDAYLDEVQKPGVLNRMDQTAQKFNQSIAYCQRQSQDLAKIQLKRILRSNPKMVVAYQLLSLVLMAEGRYDEARRQLLAAAKIDAKNPLTMTYLEETRAQMKPRRRSKRRAAKTAENGQTVVRETAVATRSGFLEILDSNGSGFVNILVGGILGVLVAIFLIVPTMRQNENNETRNALVSANKEAANTANTVAGLEKQVKQLKKELKQYTGKGNLKTSYEKLLEAQAAQEEGDIEVAGEAISVVNAGLLDPNGQALYETVSTAIGEQLAKDAYADGSAAFRARRYEDAILSLVQVVEFDPEYNDGAALYYLAQAYEYTEDEAGAARYYALYAQLYPNTSRGNLAASKAEEFGYEGTADESADEADTDADGTGTTGVNTGATTGTTQDVTQGTTTQTTQTTQTYVPQQQEVAPQGDSTQAVDDNATPVVVPQDVSQEQAGETSQEQVEQTQAVDGVGDDSAADGGGAEIGTAVDEDGNATQ